ncbi:MAG: ATP-binding cassette domain-containing protein [Chloroflexi bacterium]|nr:ATP-binding cassette domain-containing protein [Chloroflexota bacterium]
MLEVDRLRKRYGDVVALNDCSFVAQPGRVVGFLGPNGAGKTTTMRSIFGLVNLDGGEVRWGGQPVGEEARLRFGYMPEERGLYPRMKVRDQLTYFAELHGLTAQKARKSTDEWLERLGIADRGMSRLDELSHGNQQRAQLAAALVHDAELLVLDEPFAGLDPIGVATLGGVVRGEAERGRTVVFSSHQLDLVEDIVDDVVVIDKGRVALSGALAELRVASPHRFLQVAFAGTPPDFAKLTAAAADVELIWRRDGEARFRM